MRLTLFIILAALLLVTATARRGSKTPPAPVLKKHILIPQWGFPYGWGLGPGIDTQDSDAAEEKEKEMKQVKRVVKTKKVSGPVVNKKKGKEAAMPEKKSGWFGSTEHHYVEDAENNLNGLE